MTIGFIGQGWIGKNYADDFEERGYDVVRYALEDAYVGNKEKIGECDIVFVAVPTPTTEEGFDDSIVRAAMPLIGKGKTVVVKSTMLPGTTESIQKENPDTYVFHSPEFLVEQTAKHDAAHPQRNIVGIPVDSDEYRKKAKEVLDVLPNAPFETIMSSGDAEFVKYAGNCFLFSKVIFINLLYDLVVARGGNWDKIKEAFVHDPRIGESHTKPVHKDGRGAGGHCFIKDFEAFREMYDKNVHDELGSHIFEAMAHKNIQLLAQSGKDMELLRGVYGDIDKYLS